MKKKIEEFINRAAYEGGNDVILSYFVDEIMELFASQKREILDEVMEKVKKFELPDIEDEFYNLAFNDGIYKVIKLLESMKEKHG